GDPTSAIYIVLRDGSSPKGQFAIKQIASMSPADYRQYWNAKVFRGEATEEPLIVPSNGLASGLVASRVGSICIIPAANVPKDASVKLLRVDGKLPENRDTLCADDWQKGDGTLQPPALMDVPSEKKPNDRVYRQ